MNIEEIDKWLDDEYGCSYTRLEELHDFVVEQDLKHREEKDKEIERLNKELEELKHIMYIIRDDNGLNHLWCKDIILKWLKGDGSNENE